MVKSRTAILAESEARFRSTFEQAAVGIAHVSPDGRFLRVNRKYGDILGYPHEELLQRTFQDITYPDDLHMDLRSTEQMLSGEIDTYSREKRYIRKDGSTVWVNRTVALVRNESGQPHWFVSVIQDISDRKRAEEALIKSQRLLAEMEKIGKVGGWEIDLNTMKLRWTEEVYDIHEVDPAFEPTLENAIQFYAPVSRPVIERLVRRAIEHGEPYDVELEVITAEGNLRVVHSIGRADLDHRRVYGFFQDVTASKENEREMSQLRLELTHLTRVLTLNEISGSLAHEINQPLGAILNNAEAARNLMDLTQDKPEEIPEIVEDIIQDAKRAGDVVRRLRTLVKKGNTQYEPLPINTLIDEVLELLHNAIVLNNVTLRLDVKPELAIIHGDRVRLQQVLLNLVTNALDAMKKAPSRILTVRSAMDVPETVTVSVSDTGPGIEQVNRERLFQPFFTTKRDGLGLGLSICRSIIEEHGGRIWGENHPGGGATFSISLQTWKEESVRAPVKRPWQKHGAGI